MEMGGLLAPNSSIYDHSTTKGQLEPGGADGQKGQETNEVYEETAAIGCDQDGAAAPKYSGSDHRFVVFSVFIMLQCNTIAKVPSTFLLHFCTVIFCYLSAYHANTNISVIK